MTIKALYWLRVNGIHLVNSEISSAGFSTEVVDVPRGEEHFRLSVAATNRVLLCPRLRQGSQACRRVVSRQTAIALVPPILTRKSEGRLRFRKRPS